MFTPQWAPPTSATRIPSTGSISSFLAADKDKSVAFFDGPPPPVSSQDGDIIRAGETVEDRLMFKEAGLLDECSLERKNLQALLDKLSKFENQDPSSSSNNEARGTGDIEELGAEGISYQDVSSKSHTFTATKKNGKWNTVALVFKALFLFREAYKSWQRRKFYCCLFPDDYEFERDTLVQLWMAAGYLTEGRMEDIGSKCFDILLSEGYIFCSSNLAFSTGRGKSRYKVNVHKVGQFFDKASDTSEKVLYTMLKDDDNIGCDGSKLQHVCVVSNLISNRTFDILKGLHQLRTLVFVRNYGVSLKKVPSDLFAALVLLETLDLSGSNISKLPESIGNVRQLHYLDLSFTLIKTLPEAIGDLQELQTLKLIGCNKLFALPEGIKKLINLRHLFFDVLGHLISMPKGLGSLVELRTLSAFIVNGRRENCNIGELRNMRNLSGRCCISGLETILDMDIMEPFLQDKSQLTRLELRWKGDGVYKEQHISSNVSYLEPHPCLEKIKMICYPRTTFPGWLCDKKFEHLTSITFLKCENRELDIHLGQLPNLKCLSIIQMNRVKQIDGSFHTRSGHHNFPKLEKLTIECMLKLESWIGVEKGDFPLLSEVRLNYIPNIRELYFVPYMCSLKVLEICNCPKLESLSSYIEDLSDSESCEYLLDTQFQSAEKLLVKLESLTIYDCPILKDRYSKDGEEWHKIKHVPDIWFDLEDMHNPETDLISEYSHDSCEDSDISVSAVEVTAL